MRRKAEHFLLAFFFIALGSEKAFAVSCGETIKQNTTLTSDLNCPGNGITIDRDGIVLDLGGFTIRGPGKGGWVWPERALSSVGIWVKAQKGVAIRNGSILNFATAVLLEDAQATGVQGIQSLNSHYGIYIWRGRGNVLNGVQISNNVYGLHLQNSLENLIIRSLVSKSHHGSPGGYGINLYGSNRNTIMENRIEGNQSQGIWLIDSRDNKIYWNNFLGNSSNAVDETGANLWYESDRRRGNFWSDYEGSGPYIIGGFTGAKDPYPASKQFSLGRGN